MTNKITADMLIGYILRQKPEAGNILMRFGMHCLGCSIASGESLAQAAEAHGIEIDKLIEALNA